jgi:hypothetical protein
MKAQELRIGNYFQHKGHNPKLYSQVKVLTENGIMANLVTGISKNTIEPIPLTPEILKKAGFDIKKKPRIANEGNDIHVLELCAMYTTTDGYISFIFFVGDMPFIKIEYLHQLQNFHYALKGEELEIKIETEKDTYS